MSPTDPYADWDAAYVLGALSPAERREYENHLAGCAACQEAVAELAGMPGLLAQVPPGEALALDVPWPTSEAEPEPPASMMPAHLPARRLRSSWVAPLAAAAAALLIGGVGGYAASLGRSDETSPGASPSATSLALPKRVAFSPVEPTTMTAVLDLARVVGGTEVRVECQYATATAAPSSTGHDYGAVDYAIWVIGRDGSQDKLRMWTAHPGRLMRPSAVTLLPADQIRSVEIRYVGSGTTVMRADLS